MNEHPKRIFKRVEGMSSADLREHFVSKCVKIIKKSSLLENKAMINLMGTEHHVSGLLFSAYA